MTKVNADRMLLALLRENARMPVAELARRLGVSRSTAQSRLEKLERNGTIAGYALKLSGGYLSSQISAHLMATVSPKKVGQVVKALESMVEVRTVHSVSGSFDMIVVVEAPSVAELDAVIDRIGALEGVERTMSSIILSTRVDR
ncbi:Lrp/AsnC family transcriptional regulator [Pelagibacterium sp. 26DY04]|uniref:Lrp/AsnC family transcriptional regulator n=1 Tax=unclassified Pelagibacterium TaxID=2623280 RepID=UPI002815310C|nr:MULTISPECIES: Lrp/AsnC family transcriptional regulator [unclassified Pelagibacterium]WMT87241.1 Lrp/AsnC family transcriptional regulator [Pelagibacterium sp. 26DY04]WMT92063.1 Lrp/AsnC family transcriptional regulator [Pelagibacterium sp. H642]